MTNASVIAAPIDLDLSSCTAESIGQFQAIALGSIEYYNFMALIAVVLDTHTEALRESKLTKRVKHGGNDGVFIDLIPSRFQSGINSMPQHVRNEIAGKWHASCTFEKFDYLNKDQLSTKLDSIISFVCQVDTDNYQLYYVQSF